MKKMDLDGSLARRVGKDVSPKTPGRAYPYLEQLVKFLEKELPDVPHYYQGGFFLGVYTKQPRYTQDVDMSIIELSAYERVKDVLIKFGEKLVIEGMISDFVVKPTTSERSSGGAKYYAMDGSVLFSIDIGYHEKPLRTVTLYPTSVGRLRITTVEQMLCDKASALYSSRRRRRIKDLFDAWHIISTCDLDDSSFISCLSDRNLYPLPSVDGPFTYTSIEGMEEAYGTLLMVQAKNNRAFSMPSFSEVVEVVGTYFSKFSDAEV